MKPLGWKRTPGTDHYRDRAYGRILPKLSRMKEKEDTMSKIEEQTPVEIELLEAEFDERADAEYEREIARIERLRLGDDAPYSFED